MRATNDLGIRVRPEAENARRVIAALRAVGAPLSDQTESAATVLVDRWRYRPR